MQYYKIVDELKKNKKLFEQNPNPVLIVDSRGKYAGANKAGLNFLETTLDKLTQKKVWDFSPPHKLQKQKKEHKPFFAPRVLETEYYVSGKIKTLMLTVIPYHNENGEILLYGIGYDITAQKENELKLKQSERKFRSLFEDSIDGISITDLCGNFLDIDKSLVKMLGYKNKNELIGINIENLYAVPAERPEPDQGNRKFKGRLKRKDGQIIDVEISSSIIYEQGRPRYCQKIVRDITEGIKREEQLRLKLDSILSPDYTVQEEELKNIIDSDEIQSLMDDFYELTGIGVAIVDLKGKILVATGWQGVCTKFHRVNPESKKNCIESDMYLSKNVEPGKYTIYKCKNNMWDIATPITVGEKHVGNLFLGQFFFEDETPDYDVFMSQAEKYGFDKKTYLDALEHVPRWSRKKVNDVMGFYSKFAQMVSKLSFSNLKLLKTVSDYKSAKEKLEQSEKKFRSLFEDSVDGIYITTPRGKYVNANTALVKMLGYKNKKELMAIDIERDLYVSANDRPGPDQRNRTFKTRLKKKDGSIIDVEISSRVIYEEGSPKYYQGIVRNITERKKAEEKLKYLSFHDGLTGLYNRTYFDEELNRLDTKRQLPLSLIIGDVNGLKLVNDAFGHLEGDKLLKDVAVFLKKYFREEDVVARWGGDEFCMLLPRTSRQDAEKIAARIKDACTKTKNTRKIPISISLGISTKSNNNQKAVNLLKEAEDSMYKSKLIDKSSMFSSIVFSLEKTIREKSSETKEHAHRLKTNALKLGKALNLSKDRLNELTLLASLHDIGKVAIPETILLKKSKLTKNEWEIVKKHPKIGYNIAQSLPQLAHVAEGILHHHEWWDGSGYPQGFKGKDIPLISRIISLVDAYDVIRSGRPYKPALDKKGAIRELKKCSGTQFEPRLVEKFIEILNS